MKISGIVGFKFRIEDKVILELKTCKPQVGKKYIEYNVLKKMIQFCDEIWLENYWDNNIISAILKVKRVDIYDRVNNKYL